MEKIKVLHISETFIGGVYTYIRQFCECSDKQQSSFETYVIFSDKREETNINALNKDFSSSIKLIPIKMSREISFFQDVVSLFKIIREMNKIKPDIIHLHSSKAGILGRIAKVFLFKKKFVYYSPHGFSFLRTDVSDTKKKFYWLVEKWFQKIFPAKTVACGDTEFEIAQTMSPSILVRNGIDIESIKHLPSYENDLLTIGIVGRITFARNPELFNQIAIRFHQFNFIWIGDGEMKHVLTAPNIKITGWLSDRKKLIEEVNKLDVYMQTSLWEGLPMSVIEAMSLKKPVIATNVIGNKDLVKHGQTGFLFNNIDELTNFFAVLQDPTRRKIFGEKSMEICHSLFDMRKNFQVLFQEYKNCFII